MKHLLFTLLFTIPTFLFSQNYSELNASSAGNVYYSTNKNYYVTEYLTEPENRYILFVVRDSVEEYIYFNNKSEISGLLNAVIRSIEYQKDIIYKTKDVEFTIINTTKNISRVKVGDYMFPMDRQTATDILEKFSN
jgi:hypothetical protein